MELQFEETIWIVERLMVLQTVFLSTIENQVCFKMRQQVSFNSFILVHYRAAYTPTRNANKYVK